MLGKGEQREYNDYESRFVNGADHDVIFGLKWGAVQRVFEEVRRKGWGVLMNRFLYFYWHCKYLKLLNKDYSCRLYDMHTICCRSTNNKSVALSHATPTNKRRGRLRTSKASYAPGQSQPYSPVSETSHLIANCEPSAIMALRMGVGDVFTLCKGAVDLCSRAIHEEHEGTHTVVAEMKQVRAHLKSLEAQIGDENVFAKARPDM